MATVDRVLPWRRHHETAAVTELAPLLSELSAPPPEGGPVGTINRAYQMAAEAHRSQTRSSGESYINHPLAVARIVADIGLDEISLAAPCSTTRSRTPRSPWPTSSGALRPRGRRHRRRGHQARADPVRLPEAQQAATMRKMLVAMARTCGS
jgi:GTP diphosphokinase / guanosine-3',5'-bis(diphosphate) 3'-diphosphatase